VKTVILFLLLLALSQLVNSSYGASVNQRDINFYKPYLIKFEGYKNIKYRDGRHWAVGIGHNLSFEKYNKIGSYYTDAEINYFFTNDLIIALATARKYVRNFDSLPSDAKLVTISLIFTVGPKGFSKFQKFRLALERGNYKVASIELRKSKWWYQVGKERREDHFNRLNNINQK